TGSRGGIRLHCLLWTPSITGGRSRDPRPATISASPGVVALPLTSAWRNPDYADLHADGRRWVYIPDRWVGSGGDRERLAWAPCSASVAAHPTRNFSGVPPPHYMGRGTGGEANARASDWLLQRSTRARNSPRNSGGNAVHNNCSIPARIDTLISHPDPSASICVICVPPPDSSETFATPGHITIQRARCPTTRLPRRALRALLAVT